MTNHSETMIRDLTEGSALRQLISFAVPLVLANFLQTAYSLIDSMIVGQFVGATGLAGVTASSDIINLFTLICMGLGSAGQIIIAQQVGLGNREDISRTIGTLFTVLAATAVAATVIFLIGTRWMLKALNVPEESFSYAVRYILTCGMGMLFVYGYNAVSCVLRGMGDSKKPLLFVAIASVLNCIFDLIFVALFHWDTLGAALATVLGQAVSFLVSLVYLYRRKESFGFDFRLRSFLPTRESFRLLMKLGIPQVFQFAAIIISMLYVTSLINEYGVAAAAVNGVAIKLEGVCRIVTNSLSTAASAIIAQCIGAQKLDRCVSTTRCVFWICIIYCSVCAVVIGLFPRQVFSVFSTDPEVLSLAKKFAVVGVLTCFGHALRNTFFPIVNGIGFASLSLVVGLLDGVVARIGLSLLMGVTLGMGLMGFWWGSCLASYIPVIINGAYYFSGKWKTYRLFKTEDSA